MMIWNSVADATGKMIAIAALALAAGSLQLALAQDQDIKASFYVDPGNLSEPGSTDIAANPPRTVDRPSGAMPIVPDGFSVNLFADGLDHARWLALAPNGDVFLAQSQVGEITVLRDTDGDGTADLQSRYHRGLSRPHGMAFHEGSLFISDRKAIWRFEYEPGDLEFSGTVTPLTRPGAIGASGSHWTRNLAISPDGEHIYAAIGSMGNVSEDPEPHAAVKQFRIDGSEARIFASGLRNPVGISFMPGTNDLYVVVNERDMMGDGLVPDYLTRIQEGQFFGWPYAYIGGYPDPDFGILQPDKVAATVMPDVLFQSHSAPLGLVFYDGSSFPEAFHGDAFVALHGSWNAAAPTGYKVVRVPFEGGRPIGGYENFMTGFWAAGTSRARVWGRPVGLIVASDGSLLVADDVGQRIWRISYTGEDRPSGQ